MFPVWLIIGISVVLSTLVNIWSNGFILVGEWIKLFFGFSLLGTIGVLFFNSKPRDENDGLTRPERSSNNELGSGDLASKEHMAAWLKDKDALDTKFPVKNLKGADGYRVDEAKLVIPNAERNRHILIIGKTGCGKTSKLILPVLYHDCLCPIRSTVVLDSKPEMWQKLAGMTAEHNPKKKIMLFNPLDTVRSLSWNILSKIENDTDAKLIANTLIMATDNPAAKSDSPFFRNNALQLLNAIMVGLLNSPDEELSMPNVHHLVHGGKNSLCDWLEAHPKAILSTRTFVELCRSGSQNADTILSELGMRLAAWDIHAIRSTTALPEIDLESLVQEPSLFIIELRESEIEMLRPLANVIVIEILRFLTKRAESCPGQTLPRPVSLVIDEFASALGRLPDIHVKLNTLRSRNISFVAAIQSIGQIRANYQTDADSVLTGFSTKILIPTLDFMDSEWASKEAGTMTVRYKTSSEGANRKITESFANKSSNINEQIQQRAVLTPDEIGRPRDNCATFFMPNTPAFQGHLVPYYEVPEMLAALTQCKSAAGEIKLRETPLDYEDKPHPQPAPQPQAAANGQPVGQIPVAQREATPEEMAAELARLKDILDWANTTGLAREWWTSFEQENANRLGLMVKLCQELLKRNATISEFFLAYVYSDSENVEESLKYLDKLKTEQSNKAAAPATGTHGPL